MVETIDSPMITTDHAIERQGMRAQRYLQEGLLSAANATLESMLARNREHPRTLLTGSAVSLANDRMREATRYAMAAERHIGKEDVELALDAVDSLLTVGECVQARDRLAVLDSLSELSGATLLRMAVQRQTVGDHSHALNLVERARAAGVQDCDVHFYRGMQLAFAGRFGEARRELEARVAMQPLSGRAFVELSRLYRQTPEDNHLDFLRGAIEKVEPHSEDHAALEFARYKELEDLQRHDEAWQSLECGNAIMHARMCHVPGAERNLLDRLIGLCTARFVRSSVSPQHGPIPIFIVGMPRSGSSLLDRMLGGHPQVRSAGELPDFGKQLNWATDHRSLQGAQAAKILSDLDYSDLGQRYLAQTQWRAEGRRFFIDKQPSNWMLAGLIHRALPQARILNLVRDPMDVCFSNYRAYFGRAYAYSYHLPSLAEHYHAYRRLMAHWREVIPDRMMDVSYGDLVGDPEKTMRNVLNFCELEWEPCTDLERNSSPVATLSLSQVRSHIRTDAFGHWRPYEAHLSGLAEALANESATEWSSESAR